MSKSSTFSKLKSNLYSFSQLVKDKLQKIFNGPKYPTTIIRFQDITQEQLDQLAIHEPLIQHIRYKLFYFIQHLIAISTLWGFISDLLTLFIWYERRAFIFYGLYAFFTGLSLIIFILKVYKARCIIRSQIVGDAFVSKEAYQYYVIKFGYRYYCLFSAIQKSQKVKHQLCFFSYFTLQEWPQFLLLQFPKFIINLLAVIFVHSHKNWHLFWLVIGYNFSMFAIGYIQFIVALILYLPLKFWIRGQFLSQYCMKIMNKNLYKMLTKTTADDSNDLNDLELQQEINFYIADPNV